MQLSTFCTSNLACRCSPELTVLQEGRSEQQSQRITEIKARFEATVVRNVETVLIGLQKDTVYWQKGLLSTPPASLLDLMIKSALAKCEQLEKGSRAIQVPT